MGVELVPLCTLHVAMGSMYDLGPTGWGRPVVIEVGDITVTGERLSGRMLGHAASDWLVIGSDGVGRVDVRFTITTHDGATVGIAYGGRIDLSWGAGARPVYAAPVFTTGDARYRWLRTVQGVGKGTWVPGDGALTLDVYEVR